MSLLPRPSRSVRGPLPALPAAIDRCSERWWRLPPRLRVLTLVLALCCLLAVDQWRVAQAQRDWGGPPRRALVAVQHANVGERPRLRPVALPPALVPSDAPQHVPDDTRLALALPEGAVLTRPHVSPRGPAVGLDPSLRVVPLPVAEGLDIRPGARVDVWVLSDGPGRSQRVARGRPVVAVPSSDDDERVALIGLASDEVGRAVAGLTTGDVLLTQAPP